MPPKAALGLVGVSSSGLATRMFGLGLQDGASRSSTHKMVDLECTVRVLAGFVRTISRKKVWFQGFELKLSLALGILWFTADTTTKKSPRPETQATICAVTIEQLRAYKKRLADLNNSHQTKLVVEQSKSRRAETRQHQQNQYKWKIASLAPHKPQLKDELSRRTPDICTFHQVINGRF